MEAVMFDSKLVKIDKEIAKEIAKAFKVDIPEVQAMVKEYQELTLIPDDKESYAICRKGLTACVHFRTGIDKIRLAQNKGDQERIKGRNTNAKNLAVLVEPAENHLSGLIKDEDGRLEAIKAEEAEKERVIIQSRVDELLEYGKPMPFMELAVLDDEEYDTLLFDVKEDFKAEEERKAEEAEKAEAEKKRLADQKVEQDRIATVNHSLEVQREWYDENILDESLTTDEIERFNEVLVNKKHDGGHSPELSALIGKQYASAPGVIARRKKQNRIATDQKVAQDKIDADLKAIDDEKARIAKEESDKKAKIESTRKKMLSEVGILITTDDLGSMPDHIFQELYDGHKITWEMDQKQLKIEAKEREAKEKTRRETLKPDKEKLNDWVEKLSVIQCADLSSEDAQGLKDDIYHKFDDLCDWARTEIENL